MSRTTKNILSLNHEEAMNFFMKSEQYHGFELPEYFTFDEVLKYVQETVGDAPYEECVQEGLLPDELLDVNLDIQLNKDGRYAVRSIMLANPLTYNDHFKTKYNILKFKTIFQYESETFQFT